LKKELLHISTISEFSEVFGLHKPSNSLVTIINTSELKTNPNLLAKNFVLDLYSITLKGNESGVFFGRKNYDFDEGVMVFTAPNQILSIEETEHLNDNKGWMLLFHPDLIRDSSLVEKLKDYKFFSYALQEALHLSEAEQETVSECSHLIVEEILRQEDYHSKQVFVSILELLLNLCNRLYERQFNTRSIQNNYAVTKVDSILKEYYAAGYLAEKGIPNVEFLANKIGLSPNYLSDLLKKETGRSAKEYINYFVIDKAKTLLVKDKVSVSELAYQLGFNYPHYFSRIFKSKTGLTPQEYRNKY